jgi:hypothetical protein
MKLMSLIAKWALQLVLIVLLGWAAVITAGWSGAIVNGTGNDRLAQLSELPVAAASLHDETLASHAE